MAQFCACASAIASALRNGLVQHHIREALSSIKDDSTNKLPETVCILHTSCLQTMSRLGFSNENKGLPTWEIRHVKCHTDWKLAATGRMSASQTFRRNTIEPLLSSWMSLRWKIGLWDWQFGFWGRDLSWQNRTHFGLHVQITISLWGIQILLV